jgi:hypothetical protein
MIDIIYFGNENVTLSEGWNFGLILSGGWLKLLVCDGDEEKRGTNGPDYGGCYIDLLWILGQSTLVVVGLFGNGWLLSVDGGVVMVATDFLWMVVWL